MAFTLLDTSDQDRRHLSKRSPVIVQLQFGAPVADWTVLNSSAKSTLLYEFKNTAGIQWLIYMGIKKPSLC